MFNGLNGGELLLLAVAFMATGTVAIVADWFRPLSPGWWVLVAVVLACSVGLLAVSRELATVLP